MKFNVFDMIDTFENELTGVVVADKGITKDEIQDIIYMAKNIRGFVTDGYYAEEVTDNPLCEKLAVLGDDSESEYINKAFEEVFGDSVVWLTGTERLVW